MTRHLVISIGLHDRFHGMAFGAPEWPPSPARVFQALVAGAARGRVIPDAIARALDWLEGLPPPRIAVPRARLGAENALWVPNNDLDALGGDPAKVSALRVPKTVIPRILDGDEPLHYVWSWEEGGEHAEVLVGAAEQVYQLGRGVDLAWARGEVIDDEAVDRLLSAYPGVVHLPSGPGARSGCLCPLPGSLASLRQRFAAQRIREVIEKKKRTEIFANVPKPLFRLVRYDRRTELVVYDLVDALDADNAYPVALVRVAALVEAVRDAAADRLREVFPDQHDEIDRVLIGRRPDGRGAGPVADRVRILPLPSIGHEHADLGVRRLAIELPGGSSLAVDDLAWAFDGLSPASRTTGESFYSLVRSDDDAMGDRYTRASRRFRSVTAVALPQEAARRRIEPTRRKQEAKAGGERDREERHARTAVVTALRHAGVVARVEDVAVQREPFDRRGERADWFGEGTRFAKERLWHVRLAFDRPVTGPLAIGDGRFLGLGVMAPLSDATGIYSFTIEEGLADDAVPAEVARALRRAVMSRTQDALGPRAPLPAYFSGHSERDGSPAHELDRPHLYFAFDGAARRLLVVAPHVLGHREPAGWERAHLRTLDLALEGLHDLRAGRAGRLTLQRTTFDAESDPLVIAARRWRTITPYRVNRHHKAANAADAVTADVRAECLRRGLPEPRVTSNGTRGVAGSGLEGAVELVFRRPVPGPILLGRDRHLGGGLFVASPASGEERV